MANFARHNFPPLGTQRDGTILDGLLEGWVRTLREWCRRVDDRLNGPDVQVFEVKGGVNTSYRWQKPAHAHLVEVILIGGGGGGGGGRSDAAGTLRPGGGGGGGGGLTHITLPAALFRARETVIVGAGGAGATATNVVMDGNNGTGGGTTQISCPPPIDIIRASGGTGGDGAAVVGAIAATGGRGTCVGTMGAASRNDGGIGQAAAFITLAVAGGVFPAQIIGHLAFTNGPIGGASGGGITAGNVGADGGSMAGQAGWTLLIGGVGAIVNTSGAGNAENSSAGLWLPGSGGGGGAIQNAGASGGAGGNGGRYGGGGGGGSGKSSGSVVGAGGRGGDGIAVIITHF